MSASMDAELRRQLIDFGVDAGPITDSTRPIYLKKLKERMETKKRVSRRSGLNSRSLLTFSSDESDPEASTSNGEKSTTRKLRRRSRQSLPPNEATYLAKERNKSSTNYPSSLFNNKNNSTFNSTKSVGGPRSNLVDSSDSDITDNMHDTSSSTHNNNHSSSSNSMNLNSYVDKIRANSISQFVDKTRGTNSMSQFVGNLKMNSHKSDNSSKDSTYLSRLRKDFLSATTNGSGDANFYRGGGETLLTNSSHFISMVLVGVVVLFFLMLGVLYVSVRNKEAKEIQTHIDTVGVDTTYDRLSTDRKELYTLNVLNQLRNKLRQIAGAYDCGSSNSGLKRNMSIYEIRSFLQDTLQLIGEDKNNLSPLIKNCLQLFIQHPDFGIEVYSSTSDQLFDPAIVEKNISLVYCLESTSGEKSFFCRLNQAFRLVLHKLILLALGVVVLTMACFLGYWHWQQKKKFDAEMLVMTENIIGMLQKNYEASLSSGEGTAYLPIPHVRDIIIPLSERKQKKGLWEAAVRFLQDHDSRVRVECQNVDGEDYQVWRWLQPPSPNRSEPPKKLWQGQAFENLDSSPNAPPYSPTPCLKVRNMFDPDVEYGDDWHVHIQDAILEKCEGVDGIVHIKVDTSSREGCVYVKCNTLSAAGQVFKDLHGWWFDGNLVTVRYLRLERYHERFPEAVYSHTLLKSSNKRSSYGLSFKSTVE